MKLTHTLRRLIPVTPPASIRRRLMLTVMGTSAAAILLACTAYLISSITINARSIIRTTISLARITGENCEVALAFELPEDADQVLTSLQARRSIAHATLLSANGQPFAAYSRDDNPDTPPPPMTRSTLYKDGTLWVKHDILKGNRFLGILYLQDDLSLLTVALRRDLAILLIVTLFTLASAYAIALKLIPVVTRPIQRLTQTAQTIANQQDAPQADDQDELDLLTHSFDTMLATLRERENSLRAANTALQAAQDSLEHKVQLRTAELARSNRDLEQFAYIASHDLQEPLRTVKSFTQLLARRYQGKLDGEADKFISFAVDGADRMQKLIEDLLTYSRAGSTEKEAAPTALSTILADSLRDQTTAIRESGAVVTSDPLPTVCVKAPLIGMVLQNLVANAIKFRGTHPPRIHVGATRAAHEWVISVQDNGIGIEAHHFSRLFQVFQRLHTRREYPGTGIGLAVCRKIIERHGGRIWVESEPGKGSTFRFTLPDSANTGTATDTSPASTSKETPA